MKKYGMKSDVSINCITGSSPITDQSFSAELYNFTMCAKRFYDGFRRILGKIYLDNRS